MGTDGAGKPAHRMEVRKGFLEKNPVIGKGGRRFTRVLLDTYGQKENELFRAAINVEGRKLSGLVGREWSAMDITLAILEQNGCYAHVQRDHRYGYQIDWMSTPDGLILRNDQTKGAGLQFYANGCLPFVLSEYKRDEPIWMNADNVVPDTNRIEIRWQVDSKTDELPEKITFSPAPEGNGNGIALGDEKKKNACAGCAGGNGENTEGIRVMEFGGYDPWSGTSATFVYDDKPAWLVAEKPYERTEFVAPILVAQPEVQAWIGMQNTAVPYSNPGAAITFEKPYRDPTGSEYRTHYPRVMEMVARRMEQLVKKAGEAPARAESYLGKTAGCPVREPVKREVPAPPIQKQRAVRRDAAPKIWQCHIAVESGIRKPEQPAPRGPELSREIPTVGCSYANQSQPAAKRDEIKHRILETGAKTFEARAGPPATQRIAEVIEHACPWAGSTGTRRERQGYRHAERGENTPRTRRVVYEDYIGGKKKPRPPKLPGVPQVPCRAPECRAAGTRRMRIGSIATGKEKTAPQRKLRAVLKDKVFLEERSRTRARGGKKLGASGVKRPILFNGKKKKTGAGRKARPAVAIQKSARRQPVRRANKAKGLIEYIVMRKRLKRHKKRYWAPLSRR
ncbi:MAG: hypothetical protein PHQ80_03010 [Candidatus ainarchaeum sp.]|nr:hypothetical protein [Candidatus ainarchaeum sp.]